MVILCSIQLGYYKHCCFRYEWNSYDVSSHYIRKNGQQFSFAGYSLGKIIAIECKIFLKRNSVKKNQK